MSDYLKGKHVVDPVLTSIARGYKNAAFIDERVFPVVLTDKEGVCVPTFGKTAFVEYDIEHAVGTDSNVLVREKVNTLDLVPGEHDLVVPVGYRKQAESVFNEESKVIRRVANDANLRREFVIARLAQDEEVYRTGHVKKLTAGDHWAGGKGDPIGVIKAGTEAVRMAMELRPDLMTTGAGVMALLKFHPAIQAATEASEYKCITTEILQDFFQIEEIVIGAPVSPPSMKVTVGRNSVSTDIWGGNLMLHYVGKPQPEADSADKSEPPFGYTLRRKGMPITDGYDGAGGGVKHCRYTNIYKVAMVSGDAGYFTTGTGKQGGVMGATRQVILVTAVTAGTTLAQWRFVGVDDTPCKAGAVALGVAEVDAVTDDNAPVSILSVTVVEAGAVVSHGVAVQSDAQVRAVPQSSDGESCGIVLNEAGGEGDVIRILRGV